MNQKIHRVLHITSWIVGAVLFLLLAGAAAWSHSERPVPRLLVNVFTPSGQPLLLPSDLSDILTEEGAPWTGKSGKEINISLLEERLNHHPLIARAEVFSTWDGTIHVQAYQKTAKVRVIQGDKTFYLDQNGSEMPLSVHASASVPILTGDLDSARMQLGFQLLSRASQHKAFPGGWSGLTVDYFGMFTAYPVLADHALLWGRPLKFDEKANKLSVFYSYMAQAGELDSLATVNVRYHGQVVYTAK